MRHILKVRRRSISLRISSARHLLFFSDFFVPHALFRRQLQDRDDRESLSPSGKGMQGGITSDEIFDIFPIFVASSFLSKEV